MAYHQHNLANELYNDVLRNSIQFDPKTLKQFCKSYYKEHGQRVPNMVQDDIVDMLMYWHQNNIPGFKNIH